MNDCILTQEEMALQSVVQPVVFANNGTDDLITVYNSVVDKVSVESFDVALSIIKLIKMNKELLRQV